MHPMNENQPLLDFDPDFCRGIAKWAAVICTTWLAIAVCILVLVDPTGSQCPAWTIYDKNGQATSLWLFVGLFTALPTIWICFIVLRWKGFSQIIHGAGADSYKRFLASKGWYDQNKPASFTFPFNRAFVVAVVGWCLFCSIPLWVMILPCYLGH
jgi:hypothetical protein